MRQVSAGPPPTGAYGTRPGGGALAGGPLTGMLASADLLPAQAVPGTRYLVADEFAVYVREGATWAVLARLARAGRPYEVEMWRYVSGSLFTTTATTSTGTPRTVTLADVGDFRIGQGIRIRQVGQAAADLITVITGLDRAARTVTLRDQVYVVGNGYAVDHDDTEGVQRALDEHWPAARAAGQNLRLKFDAGVFKINGPLQRRKRPGESQGRYLSRVCLPDLPWTSDNTGPNPLTVELIGHSVPPQPSSATTDTPPLAGTVIVTDQVVAAGDMGASIVGGPIAEGDFWRDANGIAARSLLNVVVRRVTFRHPFDSGHFALDLRQVMSAVCEDLRFDIPAAANGLPLPGNYSLSGTGNAFQQLDNRGGGLFLPSMRWGNNYGNISARNITALGQMVGLLASEHAVIDNYVGQRNVVTLGIDDGHHAVAVHHLDSEQSLVDVWRRPPRFGGAATPALTIVNLDIESNAAHLGSWPRIHDEQNLLRGQVGWGTVNGSTAQNETAIRTVGAQHLRLVSLQTGETNDPLVQARLYDPAEGDGALVTLGNSPAKLAVVGAFAVGPVWDDVDHSYLVPQDGTYEIVVHGRLVDGAPPGVSYGLGVADRLALDHTVEWYTTAGSRNTFRGVHTAQHPAGARLQLNAYADSALGLRWVFVDIKRVR